MIRSMWKAEVPQADTERPDRPLFSNSFAIAIGDVAWPAELFGLYDFPEVRFIVARCAALSGIDHRRISVVCNRRLGGFFRCS